MVETAWVPAVVVATVVMVAVVAMAAISAAPEVVALGAAARVSAPPFGRRVGVSAAVTFGVASPGLPCPAVATGTAPSGSDARGCSFFSGVALIVFKRVLLEYYASNFLSLVY